MISPSYTDLSIPGVAEDALAEFDRAETSGDLDAWARKWGREMAMHAVNRMSGDDVDDLQGQLAAEEEASNAAERDADELRANIRHVINILEAAL